MAAPDPAEIPKVIDLASREAARYLESIADRNVRDPRAEQVAASFRGELPADGVGVDDVGLSGLPPIHVFGSGYVHPSDVKALGMLGVGRAQVHKLARDGIGRLDVEALEAGLTALDGAPSIVIGSAGEVNAGDL